MSRSRIWLIVIVLMVVESLSAIEISMIYTAMPTIAKHFPHDGRTAWLITAFLLVQAGTAAVGGRLGDLFGRKRLLVIITILCALGSLLSASSADLTVVVVGRAIQGLSGAILPLAYGVAREIAPKKDVPFWIGWLTAGYQVGAGVGYLLGGVLADSHAGWHALFFFTAIYGAIAVVPLALIVPALAPKRDGAPFDYLGLGAIPAIAAILLGVTQGGSWGWLSLPTLLITGGGVLGLVLWTWHQLRAAHPLFDIRSLAIKEVLLGNIFAISYGFGTAQMPLFLMSIIQQPVATGIGLGLAASVAGVFKIPSSVGAVFAGPVSAFLSSRFGARAALGASSLLAVTAWLMFAFVGKSQAMVMTGSIFSAFAAAMLTTAVPILILSRTPVARSSEVVGTSVAIRGVFFAIGTQFSVYLLNTSHVTDAAGGTYPSPGAFALCFYYVSAIAIASLLLAMFIPRQSGRMQPNETAPIAPLAEANLRAATSD